ncbi:MAG: DUF1844 domain-containing protein [Planctomycetota bacterium]
MSAETPEDRTESTIRDKKSDETWKLRAQKEKEKLASSEEGRLPELPPATFLGLVQELSFRALLALGQVANAATGEVYLDLDEAKYAIDMLGVLEEKTRGNLAPAEQAALTEVLHGLRLTFVETSRNPPRARGARVPDLNASEPQGGGPEEDRGPGPKLIL